MSFLKVNGLFSGEATLPFSFSLLFSVGSTLYENNLSSRRKLFPSRADPLLEGLSPSLYEQEVMKIVSLCTMTERHLGVPINLGFPSDGNCLCL